VAHISLVFRELWGTTDLNFLSFCVRELPGLEQWYPISRKKRARCGPPKFFVTSQKFVKDESDLAPILNAQGISKQFGAEPLLRNVAFTVEERARIGLRQVHAAWNSRR
jgi:hypothetical protein